MSKSIFRKSQLSVDGIAFSAIVAAGVLILTLGSIAPLPATEAVTAAAAAPTVVAQDNAEAKAHVRG